MKIHEYQARDLLRSAGIPVPPGQVIDTVEAAPGAYRAVTQQAGTDLAVIKAQVFAGGRGSFGLTLIRGLAMQLGGDIAIAPRESGGTRIVVTFPMPRDEPVPGAPPGAAPHG